VPPLSLSLLLLHLSVGSAVPKANHSGVDILLIRAGNAFDREEATLRVYQSLDILEQATSQGPGIIRGIATIRSQLELANREKTPTRDPSQVLNSDDCVRPVWSHNQSTVPLGVQEGFEGALWDHQLLLDMLGPAPISTDNLFSFANGANDGLWDL
jgi:hypothetical protein